MKQHSRILFNSLNRYEWLSVIAKAKRECITKEYEEKVLIEFEGAFDKTKKQPFHVVTLACLIQHLFNCGHKVFLSKKNQEFYDLLFVDLQFQSYFSGKENYVSYAKQEVYDLWRIVNSEKEMYSTYVINFFRREFFKGKDLSALKECITEVYYNIFDHAYAKDNAFSMLEYNEEKKELEIAICDFGIGIAKSVRNAIPEITNDKDALKKAVEYNFTVGSQKHNQGKGLDTILACSETARIIANEALLVSKRDQEHKMFEMPFYMDGSLLYLTISLKELDDDSDILEEFSI